MIKYTSRNKLLNVLRSIHLPIIFLFAIFLLSNPSPVAAQESVDRGQEVCNELHPHDPRNTEAEATKNFRACLRGYRDGEGGCNAEYPESNTAMASQRNSCIAGEERAREEEGARSEDDEDDTDSPPGPSASIIKIGPTPTTILLEDLKSPNGSNIPRESCSLDGFMGSMLCGGINIVGNMADASLTMLGAFMKTPPLTTNPSSGNLIYEYWKIFRDFANVLFAIVFLVTVYSYLTGFGLSSYSIKKTIPRIIAAALLINISYFLCSILVDVSNIIGGTIYGTMHDVIAPAATGQTQTSDPLQTTMTAATSPNSDISNWTTAIAAATTVIATSAAVVAWGGFATLLPIVLSVLLAVATTVLALLLRQALIIVFVIISPLAFASILLPQTKQFYDRWSKTFIPMLMLYPVIAFLFGAGHIASVIMGATVGTSNMPEQLIFIVMAMGVQIIPLLMVPKMMQLGGGLVAQFSGAASQKTSKINQSAKASGEKRRELNQIAALQKPTKFNKLQRMRGNSSLRNDAVKDAYKKQQDQLYPEVTPPPSPNIASQNNKEESDEDPTKTNSQKDTSAQNNNIPQKEYDVDRDEREEEQNSEPDRSREEYKPDEPTRESEASRDIHVKAEARTRAVEARAKGFTLDGTTRDEKISIALGRNPDSTDLDQEAAILSLTSAGDLGATIDYLKESESTPKAVRKQAIRGMKQSKMGTNAKFLSNPTSVENISKGVNRTNFAENVVVPSINQDDYSAQTLATQDVAATEEIYNTLSDNSLRGKINKDKANEILEAAAMAVDNEKTNNQLGKQREVVNKLSDWHKNGGYQ